MSEQFSLRWNDFHTNLSSSFHALLDCEDLVDVTLAAEGQYIQAHKLILSICSPYFKTLFKTTPSKHPIVILKDVPHAELKHILQFMYRGEVNVKQQDLTSFLATAEMLQVKGLTVGRDRSPSPSPEDMMPSCVTTQLDEGSKAGWGSHDDSSDPCTLQQDDTKSPLKRLLTNTSGKGQKKKKMAPDMSQDPNMEYIFDNDSMADYDAEMYHSVLEVPDASKESNIKQEIKQEGGWMNCKAAATPGVKCPSCHRFFANRYNLKVHIRDKHDTLEGTLQCTICHKTMRNPSCLRVHMYHHRKQAAFQAAQMMMYPGGDMDGSSPVASLITAAQKCRPEITASPPQLADVANLKLLHTPKPDTNHQSVNQLSNSVANTPSIASVISNIISAVNTADKQDENLKVVEMPKLSNSTGNTTNMGVINATNMSVNMSVINAGNTNIKQEDK